MLCKIMKLRIMVKLGFHGFRHRYAERKLFQWMHNNGVGV